MLGLPFGLLSRVGVTIATCFPFAVFNGGVPSLAGVSMHRDGNVKRLTTNPAVIIGSYVTDGAHSAIGDEFEVFVSQVSGSLLAAISDDLDTWLELSTLRQWLYSDIPGAYRDGVFTWQVREIADHANISSTCTFTLETEDLS